MASLFQRAKDAVTVFAKGGANGDKSIVAGVTPYASPPTRGTQELLDAYRTSPWLRNASTKTARAVADATWAVYAIYETAQARTAQRGAKRFPMAQAAGFEARRKLLNRYRAEKRLRPLEYHPILEMLTHGNSTMDGGTSIMLTQIYLNIKGEAFWILERNAYHMPVAFWPIPPHWVLDTPKVDRPTFRVQLPGWVGEVPEYDVVWFKEPNPLDPYGRGVGRAESLGDELDADEFASKHIKSWFWNRAIPPVVVMMEGQKKAELEIVQNEWENKNRGLLNQFRTHFINRKAEIKELGQSFQDQQLVPLRQSIRDAIVQNQDVPPEIAGILQDSNRSTIDAARTIMAEFATLPRLELMRRTMQHQLMPEFDDKLILDYDNPIPGDKEYELSVIKAFPHIVTVDELRVMVNREPIGGDEGETRVRMVNTEPFKLGETLEEITKQKASGKPEPTPQSEPKKPTKDDMRNVVAAVKVEYLADAFGHSLPDVGKFNDATCNYLLESLCEGVTHDDSLPQMVKRATNVFSEAKGKRTTEAARVEATRAKVDERKLVGSVKKALQKQESDVIRALNALYEGE